MCIIKEGVKNMWSDDFGRDIVDRLKWQYELYQDLDGYLPTPKIFDIYEEEGNTYLAMEYIKGVSLSEKLQKIYNDSSWFTLQRETKLELIDLAVKILDLTEKLHNKEYVHRDITPANFIIDRKGDVFLIDMELTYSLTSAKPSPPFGQGTPGYMSPEQMNRSVPTFKEDIYALGALLISILMGLSPSKIDSYAGKNRSRYLTYFTDNENLADLISKCLSGIPQNRPTLKELANTVREYRQKIQDADALPIHDRHLPASAFQNFELIQSGLESLASYLAISQDGIWISRKDSAEMESVLLDERIPLPGFRKGISGVMFLLAWARRAGYSIEKLASLYDTNFRYLRENFTLSTPDIVPGLFDGRAGMAIAINEGIQGHLLDAAGVGHLSDYFLNPDLTDLTIANGISGQGLSLLNCRFNLEQAFLDSQLSRIVSTLLARQQKDGSWNIPRETGRKNDYYVGVSHGVAGILCFLIAYSEYKNDEQVSKSIRQGLGWLIKHAKKTNRHFEWPISTKGNNIENTSAAVGTPGVALTFIRAYRLLRDPLYRSIAENALLGLPAQPISADYSQLHGLAGLGAYMSKPPELSNPKNGKRGYNGSRECSPIPPC
ncbi:protein kinase domain-containing protein [Puia sp. P3]|uniref:protein kinase domain-containing protein n=1 Tax=Puia sp. P3 TaxID=3423952 RepID=UPI003D677B33